MWNGFAFCISHQSGQMTKSKLCIVLGVLAALISLVFTLNFYFLTHLSADQNGGGGGNAIDGSSSGHGRQSSSKSSYMHQVRKKVKLLKPNYLNRNPRFYGVRNHIWRNFEPKPYENVSSVWDISYWVSELCALFFRVFNSNRNYTIFIEANFFSGPTTTRFIRR